MSFEFIACSRVRRFASRAFHASLMLTAVTSATLSVERESFAQLSPQEISQFNQFVQNSNATAVKVFREGRDLIESEEWSKAADKFANFIARFPREKEVDAALYWLAYTLKQQRDYPQANRMLEQLIREFPRSSWGDEARVMRTELAAQLGNRGVIEDALTKDNEEIKIVALQSLFRANPERALEYVADILKPNSTASRRMKEAAISLLGGRGNQQAVPLLLDIARSQPDVRLRQIAVFRLGEIGGESVLDELAKIYQSTPEVKVKQAVLLAYADMRSPRAQALILAAARNGAEHMEIRRTAIQRLTGGEGGVGVDELIKIYDAEQNTEIKSQLLHTMSESSDPRVQAKLLAIAQSNEEPLPVRMMAIRRMAEKDSPQVIELLIKFYDTETGMEAKHYLLHALGESRQKTALQKVMNVARADASVEMRKQAVRILGESKDPEALKFVEDLLK